MRKIIVAIIFCVASSGALAHRDHILPIAADGTLGALPAALGPVKVRVDRSPSDQSTVTNVQLTSPRFSVRLNPCVLSKLSSIGRVEATGSWYHDTTRFPPYVSLTFLASNYDPGSYTNAYYSVTFSLVDGHVLSGRRAWDPWWGQWRDQGVVPADKCSGWRSVRLWPNNSFKPKPLRGSA